MSSGVDHQMDTDADDPEFQRNCKEESELSAIPSKANSDHIAIISGDSFTREKVLSPCAPEMMQALYSGDASIQLKATQKVRQLISNMLFEPIHQVIKSGAVPRFVVFLTDTRHPELQLESAWVLNELALGTSTQTQAVIDAGAIPVLIRLLSSPNEKVAELSVQTLGNLVFDSTSRDLVLNSNILPPLLGLFNNETLSMSTVRTATWALRNLCWFQNPPPNFEQVSPCLPLLSRLIRSQDSKVLAHACWALSGLCEGPIKQIQVVINSGVCPRAVQLLSHSSTNVVQAALDLVCNITAGNDSQAQVIINENALPALGNLLSHEKELIVTLACITLSNITFRSEQQIQAVIDVNIIPPLIELLHHRDIKICKEAAWAIANATASESNEQIVYIVEAGAIAPLCKLLTETDGDLIQVALSCLVHILRSGESVAKAVDSTVNPYAALLCNSPQMRLALVSENTAIQLDATKRFGKLLGAEEAFNLLIDEVIRSGTVPRFVHFLNDTRNPELQIESARVLTDITSGNSAQTQAVIDAGAVPNLIRLISSSNENVLKKSVITLGNIACNSTESCDLLLNSNVLPPLLGLFHDNASLSMRRAATWTLRNLFDMISPPNFKQVTQCLPLLARLIVNEDEEVLANVCYALAHLCYSLKEQIQVVIESGVCPRAVQLLSHTSTDVVEAALDLVANIVTGTDSQTQVIIQANALPALGSLLSHEKESIVKNASFALSNIMAGTEQQFQAVINAKLLPSLIELLHHRDFKVRKEAAWALSNATFQSDEQIACLVAAGAIAPFTQLLTEADSNLIHAVLGGLERILCSGEALAKTAGSTVNPYATFIKRCDGFDKIALISSHNEPKIRKMALVIIGMLSCSKLELISHQDTLQFT